MIDILIMWVVAMNMTQNESILFIDSAVNQLIDYEFHWDPQRYEDIIQSRKGDCTDVALVKSKALNKLNERMRPAKKCFNCY